MWQLWLPLQMQVNYQNEFSSVIISRLFKPLLINLFLFPFYLILFPYYLFWNLVYLEFPEKIFTRKILDLLFCYCSLLFFGLDTDD